MQVTNTQYYHDLDFAEYLKMPGCSFSRIKNNGTEIPVSAGMQLGTRVHQYLSEPEKYDWQDAEMVRKIAGSLRDILGESYKYFEKEVAFTADFTHNGLTMKYKGRADALKTNHIVVDFKVLAGSLESAAKRFLYKEQISGYCLATGSPLGLIVSYNKSKQKPETLIVRPDQDWWDYQVVKYGEV